MPEECACDQTAGAGTKQVGCWCDLTRLDSVGDNLFLPGGSQLWFYVGSSYRRTGEFEEQIGGGLCRSSKEFVIKLLCSTIVKMRDFFRDHSCCVPPEQHFHNPELPDMLTGNIFPLHG